MEEAEEQHEGEAGDAPAPNFALVETPVTIGDRVVVNGACGVRVNAQENLNRSTTKNR